MVQRSLDFYFKQTKSGGNDSVNSKIEITPKQRRRTVSLASRKVPAKLPRTTTPIKSIFSAPQRTPMKLNRPPDVIITLDDPNDEVSPTPSTSKSPEPETPTQKPSSTSKASKTCSIRQRNITMGKNKSQNASTKIQKSSLKNPRILTQQSPKYCISLDDSEDEEIFQQKSPSKPSNPIKNLHIPIKSPGKTPLPNNLSFKRSLNFTSCRSPSKRQRINEIMSQELMKENSFHGYALTTTTSKIESLNVSEIFTQEANKELSFCTKSESVIKEELMLSEDEWDPEEVEKSVDLCSLHKSPPKTYLQVLPPEMINRKFDSHQNSQTNSQNSDADLQGSKKSENSKEKGSEENISENSPLRLDNVSNDNSDSFEGSFSDISDNFEAINCPRTPKKINNNTIMSLKTPERSPQMRSSFQPDRISQSPLNCLNTLGTPLKRSASTFSLTQMSPTKKNYRPRKIFKDNTNFHTVVENLNLAKQGSIPMNDFDLENIYTKGDFDFQWGIMNTTTAENYELKDVVLPMDKSSERLFEMIFWVFSEPVNCGYFNEEERDLVFKMMSLSQEEQVLLATMLKRQIRWFRVTKQKFEKLFDGNIEGSFMKLAEYGFFDSDWENVDIDIIFDLLQVNELREICKRMQISHTVPKPNLIVSLKKLLRQKTSHFGATSPREALKSRLIAVAGPILKISNKFLSLIHRILTLYYPNASPEESIADVFYLISDVHYGNKIFPSYPITRLPLFKNRQALNNYVEAKLVWMEMIQIMNDKNKGPYHWEEARRYGTQAYDKLNELIQQMREHSNESSTNQQKSMTDCQGLNLNCAGPSTDRQGLISDSQLSLNTIKKRSKLPSHISRFSATYVWSKVLMLSIEAFKKLKPNGANLSGTYLEFLLQNRDKITVNFGKIYKELTMIEMSHLRNLERSAELTIEAFSVTSSIIDQAEMMERARKLSSRIKGISLTTKERLKEILAEKEEQFLCLPKLEEIEAIKLDREGCSGKSFWLLNIQNEEKEYGTVEAVALSHYANVGYPKGIHCEGTLPVTLFACLFWKEIYELPVPGVFVSQFQREPLDLFGSNFYENRKDSFSRKFADLEGLEDFSKVWETMTDNYREFSSLQSIMHAVVGDAELFHELVKCLGKHGVLGICKKIILGGYVTWRSGFPDLFVWNAKTMKCKVVEVKGPGDTLSVKQKMWLKYLEEIGVKVEVCLVKAKQRY